jgi:cytochrome c peroxidase
MNRRSQPTRSLVAAIASILLAAGIARAGEVPPPKAVLDLPDPPFRYANPELPAHFRTAFVQGLDHTPLANPTTDAGATLGRVLFYDRRFSKDGTVSCASCHAQKHAFADPERFSQGVGGQLGDRNSMPLFNVKFVENGKFFWDERASSLEAQVLMPIEDKREMAHRVDAVVATVRLDPAYAPLFRLAFGDDDVTADRVARAMAQFVRSIVSYQSKFDDGLAQAGEIRADFPNFTAAENLGKKIFLGDHDPASRGNCATCHLRNYAFFRRDNKAVQSALFVPDRLLNNGLDAELTTSDNGVGDLTLNPRDYGLFKTPDLRNIELTAPYMHDGRFQTLEEVVEHYNTGVKAHPNLDPQLRGGSRRGVRLMNLNGDESSALVAFLKTLTDHKLINDPKYSDPFRR